MTLLDLPSCGDPIAYDDALAAVIGYCLGTRPLTVGTPTYPQGVTVDVPRFAYRAYDCTPSADEEAIAPIDVLVTDGMNAQLNQAVIEALMDAGRRAWPFMADAQRLAAGAAFWELDEGEVGLTPPSGGPGKAMNRAWGELMSTTDVEVARAHKLLHHKMPKLFPLLDGLTAPALAPEGRGGQWLAIHRELTLNAAAFERLEVAVNDRLRAENGVDLYRLRMHDILLWLTKSGNWGIAVEQGRPLLGT